MMILRAAEYSTMHVMVDADMMQKKENQGIT
jgi:hypothetical protein